MGNQAEIAGQIQNMGNQVAIAVQGKKNQERAFEYQKKMMGIQQQYANQNALKSHELGLNAWKKTSYPEQVEQMKKAGLNPALMYKGSGAGGTLQQPNVQGGGTGTIGMPEALQPEKPMAMAQLGLIQAQKENIEADTANKKADATFTGGAKTEATTQGTETEKSKSKISRIEAKYAEMMNSAKLQEQEAKGGQEQTKAHILLNTSKDQIQKIKDETKNEGLKTHLLEAEQKIKEFEVQMTKDGIPPNSPWYAKMLGDLLNKMGIMELLNIGKGEIKKQVE